MAFEAHTYTHCGTHVPLLEGEREDQGLGMYDVRWLHVCLHILHMHLVHLERLAVYGSVTDARRAGWGNGVATFLCLPFLLPDLRWERQGRIWVSTFFPIKQLLVDSFTVSWNIRAFTELQQAQPFFSTWQMAEWFLGHMIPEPQQGTKLWCNQYPISLCVVSWLAIEIYRIWLG